jgi:hypothetical protein
MRAALTAPRRGELPACNGWGDALNATLKATTHASGSCNRDDTTFPARPILPLGSWRRGEGYFVTTATAAGAIGNCTTTWAMTFTNRTCTPAGMDSSLDDAPCDHATAGNTSLGCVGPRVRLRPRLQPRRVGSSPGANIRKHRTELPA